MVVKVPSSDHNDDDDASELSLLSVELAGSKARSGSVAGSVGSSLPTRPGEEEILAIGDILIAGRRDDGSEGSEGRLGAEGSEASKGRRTSGARSDRRCWC
eukprot:2276173-Rhodomonas_salina.1